MRVQCLYIMLDCMVLDLALGRFDFDSMRHSSTLAWSGAMEMLCIGEVCSVNNL